MDNHEYTSSYATLTVYSRSLSVDELTQLIPLSPHYTWQKGTPRSKRNPSNVHPFSGLDFESRLDRSAGPEAHLDDLINLLIPAWDALREFGQRARVEDPETTPLWIRFIVETTRHEIGFGFSSELTNAMADLGVRFGVELEIVDEARTDISGETMDNQVDKESYASFVVYSTSLSVEELGRLVPLTPDRTWQKGTPRVKRDPTNVHRLSGMSLESRLDRSEPPEAHLDGLLDRVNPVRDALREYARRAPTEELYRPTRPGNTETSPLRISFLVRSTRTELGFDFSCEQLEAMAYIGSCFGMEIRDRR
jgi:hypothetical protein